MGCIWRMNRTCSPDPSLRTSSGVRSGRCTRLVDWLVDRPKDSDEPLVLEWLVPAVCVLKRKMPGGVLVPSEVVSLVPWECEKVRLSLRPCVRLVTVEAPSILET